MLLFCIIDAVQGPLDRLSLARWMPHPRHRQRRFCSLWIKNGTYLPAGTAGISLTYFCTLWNVGKVVDTEILLYSSTIVDAARVGFRFLLT